MKSLFAVIVALLAGAAQAGAPFVALDRAAARQLVDPAAHARPTIVALWSTECTHCKKNLELFARLGRADRRLHLVTVAVEPVSERLDAPLDRLRTPGARYAYGDDMPEAVAYALDPMWHGELPRTLFFDGRGGRAAVSGVIDEAAALRHLGLAPGRAGGGP